MINQHWFVLYRQGKPIVFEHSWRVFRKQKKEFEIKLASQNLFLISFENEEDLEFILEGCSWLFRQQLINFDRLSSLVDRDKISFVKMPIWVKIGLCPPECEKKYLMRAIGSTFGGLIWFEEKGDYCHIKVVINVQYPLHREIFVNVRSIEKFLIPFKYENLPVFCFGCVQIDHGVKDWENVSKEVKNMPEE